MLRCAKPASRSLLRALPSVALKEARPQSHDSAQPASCLAEALGSVHLPEAPARANASSWRRARGYVGNLLPGSWCMAGVLQAVCSSAPEECVRVGWKGGIAHSLNTGRKEKENTFLLERGAN